MGLVNQVVPVDQLEAEGLQWASEVMEKSPLAIRCLKSAFNAELDGQAGIQELSGKCDSFCIISLRRSSRVKRHFWKRGNRTLVEVSLASLIFPISTFSKVLPWGRKLY